MEEKTIGIGITTHNRFDMFHKTYSMINNNSPQNCKIVVVDDASNAPNPYADYRFETNVGIAKAKNKCLELLSNCEHIFLFDDDTYPIIKDWWKPYVESRYNHLCLSFENNSKGQRFSHSVNIKEKRNDVWIWNAPNGCMLYFKKISIDTVGGYDTRFVKWSREHENLSRRIHNAGLTPFAFMDIPNAADMFWIGDYYGIESSVPENVRRDCVVKNESHYRATMNSKEFINFK